MTTDSRIGGTEKNIISLTTNLNRERFENIVVALMAGGGLIDEFTCLNVKAYCVGMTSKFDIMAIKRLYNIIKKSRIDILHTYLFHANLLGRIIGKMTGVKFIVSSERCLDLERGIFSVWINRLTAIWADKIITVSDSVREMLIKRERISEEKLIRIYSGIDLNGIEKSESPGKIREEFKIVHDSPLVGCVGRFRREKGQSYLIQVIPDVLKKFPKTVFLFVGDGEGENRLKSMAKRLGISSNVIFTGYRKDNLNVISSLDLLVLPSLEEGLPRVALEAQAIGIPVVASNVGGVIEAVDDGKTGILVPPRDINALSNAIVQLLSDRLLRLRMGEEGRKYVQSKFRLENTIEQIERLYSGLLR